MTAVLNRQIRSGINERQLLEFVLALHQNDELCIDSAAELVMMQIQLAQWQRNWRSLWADTAQRIKMTNRAGDWSKRLLELSFSLSGGVASKEAS